METFETATAKDFTEFFSKIPHQRWCTDQMNDGFGRHCALGHLAKTIGEEVNEVICQTDSWKKFVAAKSRLHQVLGESPSRVNDWGLKGAVKVYSQTHPKDRILAALKDAIEAGR